MDEVRKVARAYYNGAERAEKKLARNFFRSLDTNGDGKVSRSEYEKKVLKNSSSFTDINFFEELDADRNKTLDFDEVLALYYMEKVSVPRCTACKSLLVESYFSCLECQADVSYYLCCDCYGRGSFKHHHPSSKFIDTRAMLKMLDQILKKSQIITNQPNDNEVDEDEATEDEDEEEEDEDEDEEEKSDVGVKCTVKKTKKNGKAGGKQSNIRKQSNMKEESNSQRSRKRDKIAKSLKAMDAGLSIGSAAVSVGAIAVATTGCCIM